MLMLSKSVADYELIITVDVALAFRRGHGENRLQNYQRYLTGDAYLLSCSLFDSELASRSQFD